MKEKVWSPSALKRRFLVSCCPYVAAATHDLQRRRFSFLIAAVVEAISLPDNQAGRILMVVIRGETMKSVIADHVMMKTHSL